MLLCGVLFLGIFKDRQCLVAIFRRGGHSALFDSIECNVLTTDSLAEHGTDIEFRSLFDRALLLLTLELIVVHFALSVEVLIDAIGMPLHTTYYYGKETEESDDNANDYDIDHLSSLGLIHLSVNYVFSECGLHLRLVLTNAFLSDGITQVREALRVCVAVVTKKLVALADDRLSAEVGAAAPRTAVVRELFPRIVDSCSLN